MNDVNSILDLWTTAFLNAYNTYKANGGIWFYVSIAVIVIFPILKKMVKSLRGGR